MRDYQELCRTLIKVALKAMRALFIWLFCLCEFTAARGSQLHIHLSIHRYYIIQSRFIFRIFFARMFCLNEQEYPFAVELNEWAIYESILTLHIHQFITNQFFLWSTAESIIVQKLMNCPKKTFSFPNFIYSSVE